MTEKIAELKEQLEQEKARLQKELGTIAHQKTESDGAESWEAVGTLVDESTDADPNEVADKIEEFETNQAIASSLKAKLTEVEGALKKIEEGKFGVCVVCGGMIEDDRLGANPGATTCKVHMS